MKSHERFQSSASAPEQSARRFDLVRRLEHRLSVLEGQ